MQLDNYACGVCGMLIPFGCWSVHVCEPPAQLPSGWVCPKCGYVWAAWVTGCEHCNQPQTQIGNTSEEVTE